MVSTCLESTTSRLMIPRFLFFWFMVMVLMLSGCGTQHRSQLEKFNVLYGSGQYSEAASSQVDEGDIRSASSSDLLAFLQAAAALRANEEYEQSSLLFDICEDIIKVHNQESLAGSMASTTGAVLINDTVLDYRSSQYDGIMVNTYKALNFWQNGQKDLARVEFNRALDRQRRAKEIFAAEIRNEKEQMRQAQAEKRDTDLSRNTENPEIDQILRSRYSNLYEFKAYPDFINPFTTYVAGLFFIADGDAAKGVSLLKEVYGMVDNHPTVQRDFIEAERAADGLRDSQKYVWIIFENGLGPEKKEIRVDLPLFLVSNQVRYTGIALPQLRMRDRACSYLQIDNGQTSVQTSMLASMDRIIQTEFKKKYKGIVSRAVASAAIKTTAQYMAQREMGDLGGIMFAIFQAFTTAADIRIWTALPKEFQLAKIETPTSGNLMVETSSGLRVTVAVPPDKNAIVYVKIPATGLNIAYELIEM